MLLLCGKWNSLIRLQLFFVMNIIDNIISYIISYIISCQFNELTESFSCLMIGNRHESLSNNYMQMNS